MKLAHINDLFDQNHLQLDEVMQSNFRMLDQFLYDLFPTKHQIAASMQNICLDDNAQRGHTLTMKDLPYHTRDNIWLAKYVTNAIKQLMKFNEDPEKCHNTFAKQFLPYRNLDGKTDLTTPDNTQPNVKPLPNIVQYVAAGPNFDKYRCRYEQTLVQQYINCLSRGMHPAKETYAGLQGINDYDQFFRCRVVQAMVDLGIDRHSIEISLEINADMWRNQAMHQAFKNIYHAELDETNLCTLLINQNPQLFSALIQWREIRAKHRRLWLKKREWAYYQKHQAIIDELGLATPNMLLNPEQVKRLDQNIRYCDRLHQKMRAKFQQAAQSITIGQPALEL